jgi:hypothetical protein
MRAVGQMDFSLDRIELPAKAMLFAEGDSGEAAYLIQRVKALT